MTAPPSQEEQPQTNKGVTQFTGHNSQGSSSPIKGSCLVPFMMSANHTRQETTMKNTVTYTQHGKKDTVWE